MVMHKDIFNEINGFDESFFLYLEDVDICKRIANCGYRICVDSSNKVMHDAQRDSHKNLNLFRPINQFGINFFTCLSS